MGSNRAQGILLRIDRKRLTNTPVRQAGSVLKCPDDRKNRLVSAKRRTRAEVQQLVAEFVSSGMRRSEFCQSRGLSFSTLDRHLKKLRWKRRRKPISSAGRLVPVELAFRESPKQHEPSCGLAVVLPGGRRIEVHPDFDTSTLERLVSLLERA
jgi:hypothetical protein